MGGRKSGFSGNCKKKKRDPGNFFVILVSGVSSLFANSLAAAPRLAFR
jgi:hypothetical protein